MFSRSGSNKRLDEFIHKIQAMQNFKLRHLKIENYFYIEDPVKKKIRNMVQMANLSGLQLVQIFDFNFEKEKSLLEWIPNLLTHIRKHVFIRYCQFCKISLKQIIESWNNCITISLYKNEFNDEGDDDADSIEFDKDLEFKTERLTIKDAFENTEATNNLVQSLLSTKLGHLAEKIDVE